MCWTDRRTRRWSLQRGISWNNDALCIHYCAHGSVTCRATFAFQPQCATLLTICKTVKNVVVTTAIVIIGSQAILCDFLNRILIAGGAASPVQKIHTAIATIFGALIRKVEGLANAESISAAVCSKIRHAVMLVPTYGVDIVLPLSGKRRA